MEALGADRKSLKSLLEPLEATLKAILDRLAFLVEPEGVLDLGSTGSESAELRSDPEGNRKWIL